MENLGISASSIYWFNPVMWIAFILLGRDIEAACDERVIIEIDEKGVADYTEHFFSTL